MSPTSAGRGATSAAYACRILIMAALPLEVRPFLRQVKARARRDLGLPAWNWEAGVAVVALSGMGAAAARRAGETLVERCRPELLVSVGFGGALTPGWLPGIWSWERPSGIIAPIPGNSRRVRSRWLPGPCRSSVPP